VTTSYVVGPRSQAAVGTELLCGWTSLTSR